MHFIVPAETFIPGQSAQSTVCTVYCATRHRMIQNIKVRFLLKEDTKEIKGCAVVTEEFTIKVPTIQIKELW